MKHSVGKRNQRSIPSPISRPLLSPIQVQILDHYDRGLRHKETAVKLKKSVRTIRWHVALILAKTGTRSCQEALYQLRTRAA